MISLSKKTFDECIIQGKWNEKIYLELQAWLSQNCFFYEDKIRVAKKKQLLVENDSTEISTGFFDLRSKLSPLNVLWALSPKCNLDCIYCFPAAKVHNTSLSSPTTENLLKIADKIIEAKVLKVTLTGGECLLLENLWVVVKRLKNAGITTAILTNGTSITKEIMEKIKEHNVFVGISLDGSNEEINKLTRGKFNFEKTIKTINKLLESGIHTTVMTTITKHNFSNLDKIIELLSKLGVVSITLQDLRPFGTKEIYDQTRLTPTQEKELRNTLNKMAEAFPKTIINTTELMIFHKPNVNGMMMQCPAGDNFAYIDFYGDLYPCTSLPSFKLGNLLTDSSVRELWQNSEPIKLLRNIKNTPLDNIPMCSSCINKNSCDGGCRGDALFYTDDLFGIPPRCPVQLEHQGDS